MVFPILLMCLFGIIQVGIYMFGVHQAQRTVEESARLARVISQPTKEELLNVMKDAQQTKHKFLGNYEPSVLLISQFDSTYAELKITYTYRLNLPFVDKYSMKNESVVQVKLRELPV